MRLQELFQITELSGAELRKIRDLKSIPSPGDLQEFLVNSGMMLIGSGWYSQVYSSSGSPWVVKVISQTLEMMNNNQRCGIRWLRYCNKNAHNNPHLPKVPYVRTIPISNQVSDTPESIYVAVIEKLEPISESNMRSMPRILLQNGEIEELAEIAYTGIFNGFETVVWDGFGAEVYRRYPNAVRPIIDGLLDDYAEHQEVDDSDPDGLYGNPMPSWPYDLEEVTEILGTVGGYNLMKELARIFIRESGTDTPLIRAIKSLDKFGCTKDLHFENIMVRPKTTDLVITDPFTDD